MKKTKKILSIFLVLIMCLGIMPIMAFAVPPDSTNIWTGTYTVGDFTYSGGSGNNNSGFSVILECVTSNNTTVNIPQSVRAKASTWNYYDDEDREIEVGARIRSFSNDISFNCPNATSYETGCSLFSVSGGVLFSADGKGLISYPAGRTDSAYGLSTKLTKIYKNAFKNCKNLKRINYPGSYSDFKEIDGYQYVAQSAPNATICYQSSPYWYSVKNNEAIINDCYSDDSTVTIPEKIDGLPVTGIAKDAFRSSKCGNVTKVVIHKGIKTIADRAFDGASKISSIVVDSANPNYTSVAPINSNYQMLYTKDKKKLVRCPSSYPYTGVNINQPTEIIGDSALDNCTKMEVVYIASTVTEIEAYAFFGCNALEAVNFNGKRSQWDTMIIRSGNSCLLNADIRVSTKEYKVNFYDGSTLLGSKYMEINKSNTLTYGSTPSKANYTFKGWSKSSGSSTVHYSNGEMVTNLSSTDGAIVNLYAVWVRNGTLSSISVTTQPTKKTYITGQNFDKSGMVVKAYYTDGTSQVITNYTVTNGTNLFVGKTSVTISYTEGGVTKTTTVPITVTPIPKVCIGLIISTQPTKTTYNEGENFDKSGMVVKACYDDSSVTVITNYTVTNGTNLTAGQSSVTISYTYEGVTRTTPVSITVNAKASVGAVTVTGIQRPVAGLPIPQNSIGLYNLIGCNASKDKLGEYGIWIETSTMPTTYSAVMNGTRVNKNDTNFKCKADKYYTFVMEFKAYTGYKFTNSLNATINGNKAGLQVLTDNSYCIVWYCFGKPVILTGMEITSVPNTTELKYKSSASTDGLKVIARYSDGSTGDITREVTVKDFSANNKKGNYTATVEYEGMYDTFDYSVKYSFSQWLLIIFLFGWIWY